jgi:hypothetical protein
MNNCFPLSRTRGSSFPRLRKKNRNLRGMLRSDEWTGKRIKKEGNSEPAIPVPP